MATIAIQLAIGIGGFLLQQLLAPKPKDIYGPRISDLNVAAVSPGNPIIRHWGTMKLPCQVLWLSPLIETKKEEEVGGKGMGGGQKSITYHYSIDCAFGVCEGPVHRIRRIRANQKVLWVNPEIAEETEQDFGLAYQSETARLLDLGVRAEEAHVSGFIFAFNYYSLEEYNLGTEEEAVAYVMANPVNGSVLNQSRVEELFGQMLDSLNEDAEYKKYKKRFDDLTIYLGGEDQLPDPTIESYEGVGNVPAHRGTCYFVLKNLQLEDFGNAIPTFTVEVEKEDGQVYLHDILDDICLQSGMGGDEFSTQCGMPLVPINGFAVTQNSSGREVIGELQRLFPFDATETSYKLRFYWMERRPQAIIRREDMGAFMQGDERPPSIETTRFHDYDFPKRLNLTYQEPERAYSTNTVFAKREQTDANTIEDNNVTISMPRAEAKTWIEKMMAHRFMSKRQYKTVLPTKYAILDATDIVLIEDPHFPGKYQQYKVVEVNIGANRLVEVLLQDYYHYTGANAVTEFEEADPGDPSTGSATFAFLYDTPLLTDMEEDNIGFYAIVAGSRQQWSGGSLVVDVSSGGEYPAFEDAPQTGSSGSNWVVIAQNFDSVLNGFCYDTLRPDASPMVRDWGQEVIVQFIDRTAVLYSYEEEDLQSQPYNLMFIGDELIQFAEAEDLQNGVWRLKGLMRGLRGTDYYIDKHVSGERAVKLRMSSVDRVQHDVNMIGLTGNFRAYGYYEDVADVQSFQFTPQAKSKWPLRPHVWRQEQIDDDWVFEWLPRVRQNGGLNNGGEVVLDQPFEKYELDVVDGSGNVVRTVSLTDTRTWTYSAAQQTADFGSVQSIARVNVYQIGMVGASEKRGFAMEVRAAA